MLTFLNYVLFFDIKLCGPLGIEIDSVNPLVALCLAFLNMWAFPGEYAQGIAENNTQPVTAIYTVGVVWMSELLSRS